MMLPTPCLACGCLLLLLPLLLPAVCMRMHTGALTCTGPGAIAPQPSLQQVQKLYEESKGWYQFW